MYSLYGHLNRVAAEPGQSVKRGDIIGYVGAEGIAQGPHLHFEVRVGNPFDYRATRNPDLWVFPYFGFGTLAGRVTDSAGNILNDVTLSVINENGVTRYTFSYADDTVNGDFNIRRELDAWRLARGLLYGACERKRPRALDAGSVRVPKQDDVGGRGA